MKVEKEETKFSPVTITLENEKEVRCLFRLSGDQLYEALKKKYGEEAGEIVDFKTDLHVELEEFYTE